MRLREIIKTFKPYEWEPSNEQLSRKLGIPKEEILRFDMNTMPFHPRELMEKFARIAVELPVNEYPDPTYSELREALAKYLNIDMDNLMVTVGADEALDIIAKTFIDPGTEALVSSPTYSMYRVTIEALGGKIRQILRREDFSDDMDSLIGESKKTIVRAIFLCSPNNPTGNTIQREEAVRLLNETDCAVIVDESYAEFSGETLVNLTEDYENLIIIRTFSKAFSLAGVRVGYVVANKNTIKLLNAMRPPNSVSVISLALAKLALENVDYMVKGVREVISERERLQRELSLLPNVKVYPSKANFILVRFSGVSASTVYDRLLREGIVVRKLSGPMLENCLRITVRLRSDNDRLIRTLKRILS